jgi:Flp pilus assembly protein TadG
MIAIKRERARGQSLVEFALVFPLLILMLLGLFDFGRAIYAYNTVSNAAREAARVAIVNPDVPAIRAEAVSQAIALGVDPASVTVDFHEAGDPDTTCDPPEFGCVAVVTVPYEWAAITPVIGDIIGPIEISSTSSVPIENAP